MFLAALVGAVAFACLVGSGCASKSSVPSPPIKQFLPPGYRALKTYRADLSGGAVPDVIVTSATKSRRLFPGADLQVLSWNPPAGRWRLTFDGRSATWPKTMVGPGYSNSGPGYSYESISPVQSQSLLGTKQDVQVSVNQVGFAPLLGGRRNQLVFSGTYVAGGGIQGLLIVVDVHKGRGRVTYAWEGDTGIGPWRISRHVIRAEANYMAFGDSECCPVRPYRFSIGARAGRLVEISDDRPFLGIVFRDTPIGHPAVVLVARDSPASDRLRVRDVILGVENSPRVTPFRRDEALEYSVVDRISSFRAGQTARLLVQRGGRRITVNVKLGSLKDPVAAVIRTPTTNGSENAL